MNRRTWLQGLFAAAGSAVASHVGAAAGTASKEVEALQKNWRMLLAQGAAAPSPAEKLKLSQDEWRKRLDRKQYHVLREEGASNLDEFRRRLSIPKVGKIFLGRASLFLGEQHTRYQIHGEKCRQVSGAED